MTESKYQIETYNSFKALPDQYLESLANIENLHFDQTTIWYELFSQHILSENQKPILFCVVKNGELFAFMPFYVDIDNKLFKQTLSLCSMSNYFSAHFTPLIRGDQQEQVEILRVLVDAIKNTKWNQLDINPTIREDNIYQQLCDELANQGFGVESYYRFANWCLDLHGRSYSEYINSIPKNIQNTLARKYKKIQLVENYRYLFVEKESQLQDAIDDYVMVYQRRWNKGEEYNTFFNELLKKYFQQGLLRFGLIYIDQKPIAAQVWFVYQGTAYIFKVAHDRKYDALSVGTILTALLIEHVVEVDKVKVVDYLCGDESFKKNWMNVRKEAWGIRVYRNGVVLAFLRNALKVIRKAFVSEKMNKSNSSTLNVKSKSLFKI